MNIKAAPIPRFKGIGAARTLSFLLLTLPSCATLSPEPKAVDQTTFCENGRANSQHVFVLAAYNGVPKGMSLDKVGAYVEDSTRVTDFVRDHFVQALLVNFYSDSSPESVVRNGTLQNLFRSEFSTGYSRGLRHLAWVGGNRFAVCKDAVCDGMKFPEAPSMKIAFDDQKWSDGRCHDFFLEDGYIAGLGCRGNAYGALQYMKSSGFNGGWLVANLYLSIPKGEERKLCTDAGQKSDCFEEIREIERFKSLGDLTSTSPQLSSNFPYTKPFFGTNPMASDWSKKKLRSAFSSDIALLAGKKISQKVVGDWTIYRITWDPSPFCRFGRTNEDFVSH